MGCATGIVKYLVFISNLVFAIAGLALVVIGILVKLNVSEATRILPKDFAFAPIISIIVGAVVFITAFLGCCGAVRESTCMLTTYSIVLLTIFIIQVAIGVYVFLQIRDTNSFNAAIEENVQRTFNSMLAGNHEANETMHITERIFKCCGVKGPEDYSSTRVPLSCCHNVQVQCPSSNNEVNSDGCASKLQTELQRNAKIIGGVAVGVALIEILGAVFGLCLASSIRNQYRRHIYA